MSTSGDFDFADPDTTPSTTTAPNSKQKLHPMIRNNQAKAKAKEKSEGDKPTASKDKSNAENPQNPEEAEAQLSLEKEVEIALKEDEALESNPAGEGNGENFKHNDFLPEETFFGKLREVLGDEQFKKCEERLKRAWRCVVKISGSGKDKETDKDVRWNGTGWLIKRPGVRVKSFSGDKILSPIIKSYVITNRHVYGDAKCSDIKLKACFEHSGEFNLEREPVFKSNQVSSQPNTATQELDFVVLKFVRPTDPIERQNLVKLCETPLSWEESGRIAKVPNNTLAVIIGHPRGGSKKGSIAQLTSDFNSGDQKYYCTARYTKNKSRPGNSGSPVFLIDNQHLTCFGVGALHFASGLGVMFIGGIAESLRAQFQPGELTEERFKTLKLDQEYYKG